MVQEEMMMQNTNYRIFKN